MCCANKHKLPVLANVKQKIGVSACPVRNFMENKKFDYYYCKWLGLLNPPPNGHVGAVLQSEQQFYSPERFNK